MSSFLARLKDKKNIATNIHIMEEFLSLQDCKTVLGEIDLLEMTPATIGTMAKSRTAPTIRDAETSLLSKTSLFYNRFSLRISDVLEEHFGVDVVDAPEFKALRYREGGHYKTHSDASKVSFDFEGSLVAHRIMDRDLSVILYLNEDFTGGELTFAHIGKTVTPKAGMLVCFPSDWRYEHIVHPITEGVRYAVVNWYRTDPALIPEREPVMDSLSSYYFKA